MNKKLFLSFWLVLAVLLSLTISPAQTLAQNYGIPDQNALNQNITPLVNQVKDNSYQFSWWLLIIPIILLGIAYIAFKTADEVAGRDEFAYHDIDLDEKEDEQEENKDKPSKKILHKID